jgi:hypothetical protein
MSGSAIADDVLAMMHSFSLGVFGPAAASRPSARQPQAASTRFLSYGAPTHEIHSCR